MIFVVDAAGVGKDLSLEPFKHLWGGSQAYAEVGKLGLLKQ
nr:hypothetical protein [Pseudomonas libanensis]